MNILDLRQQLKTKPIYDIPLRVTFYARVSTDKDEQLNSLANQTTYYQDFIQQNKNWEFVDGYIDEGLSGITSEKREKFNKMIDDAKQGKFDMIITKEVSRFARNLLDSIVFTRELLKHNVGVFFQNDNINTLYDEGELRLSIMATLAQEESRKLSTRIRFGHEQAIKKGVVLGNGRMIGYNQRNGILIVNEEQAEMVRELFELYATGSYSLKQIARIFDEKGYRNHNGNPFAHNTLANIITNPKYKGYYCGNKVKIVDMFTKKQQFLPQEEWVMYKDTTGKTVPAIVDEKIWDKANSVFKHNSEIVKSRKTSFKHENIYTGKLICATHNTAFYRKGSVGKDGNKTPCWICSHKLKNGADSCKTVAIYEDEINAVVANALVNFLLQSENSVAEYLDMFEQEYDNDSAGKNIASIYKQIELINQKKDKILEYNIEGKISDNEFIARNNKFNDDIMELNRQIQSIKTHSENKMKIIERIKDFAREIERLSQQSQIVITKALVDKLIDRIYVAIGDEKQIQLTIVPKVAIDSDYKIDVAYTSNKSRSGIMVKNICPENRMSFVREIRTVQAHQQTIIYECSVAI